MFVEAGNGFESTTNHYLPLKSYRSRLEMEIRPAVYLVLSQPSRDNVVQLCFRVPGHAEIYHSLVETTLCQ